jgi:hypothetical protein
LRAALPILTMATWALALAAAAQTPAPDNQSAAASPARTPSAERYKATHGLHGESAKHGRYQDYRMGTKSGHHGGRVCSEQAGHKVCEWR